MAQQIAGPILSSICRYSTDLLFREIVVINESAVPLRGPMMMYGNHNNQFIDGILMKRSCPRPIKFITAASSLRKPVIGPFMAAGGAIPLQRAMDLAIPGPGKIIKIQDTQILGEGTRFSTLTNGETIDIGGDNGQLRIKEIISDTQLIASRKIQEQKQFPLNYRIIPKLNYDQVYSKVWQSLSKGDCVGIFPEGGSHDRMQMIPLKAGICIFALGAMQKYGCQVTLVSCGFNYYNPQYYRSKVIVQFGVPYKIPFELVQLYKTNRKEAISTLLKQVQNSLLLVTTHSKNFNQLSTLFTIRELYMLGAKEQYTEKQKIEINRRFLKGFQETKLQQTPQGGKLLKEVAKFDAYIRNNGLKASQPLKQNSLIYDLFAFIFYFLRSLNRVLFTLPGLILLTPALEFIAWKAEKQRIRCLKASKVKIVGNDVVGSIKLRYSFTLLPITFLTISVLIFILTAKFTSLSKSTCFLISFITFILYPFYLRQAMPSLDTLNHTFKKLKYLFLRLFRRDSCIRFNKKRIQLSQRLRQLVKKYADKVFPNFSEIRIMSEKELNESNKLFEEMKQEIKKSESNTQQ